MKKNYCKILRLRVFILTMVLSLPLFSQTESIGEMFELTKLKSGMKNRRISSTDPTGGNRDHLEPFAPGEKRTIAEIKGRIVVPVPIHPDNDIIPA